MTELSRRFSINPIGNGILVMKEPAAAKNIDQETANNYLIKKN